jgi:cytochrome c
VAAPDDVFSSWYKNTIPYLKISSGINPIVRLSRKIAAMKTRLGQVVGIVSFLTLSLSLSASAEEQSNLLSVGQELVSKNCSRCHAIAADDISRHPQAPAFRTLGKRYPLESLEEALAEGIFTGHPDMPEFQFEPRDIQAVITYLKSIQQK